MNQQQQGNQVNPNLVHESYRAEVERLMHELLVIRAYAKQLEQELAEVKSSSKAQEE